MNIEFLRKQMDKVLEDIEKLKDANREMKYTRTELLTMIESVVALIMFVGAEIKEARLQETWYGTMFTAESVTRRDSLVSQSLTNVGKVRQN